MGSIPGPIVSFRWQVGNINQSIDQASKQIKANLNKAGTDSATSFVAQWQKAAAQLRTSLSTEKLGLNDIQRARESIIATAKREIAVLQTKNNLTKQELTEAVTNNLEELERMTLIIEFLLNFSNVENRLTRLMFTSVDVVEMANKAVGLTRRLADEKQIVLRVDGPDTATVSGNATAIEEMIINLVKNAIAYTPHGGTVTVVIHKKFGTVTFSVEDTGAGISPKDVPKVFEAFYRGENTVIKKRDGSMGLGLAIVREIAAFHGATAWVKSERGKGTAISVRFPRKFPWGFLSA